MTARRKGDEPGRLRPLPAAERRAAIELLDQEHLMTLAVLGPDGWPRASTVGFYSEDLDIYLVTARNSDKLGAIRSDPRVAIAIRHEIGQPGNGLALSMTGRAEEVFDPTVAERINKAVIKRYPEGHLYCPQQHSVAIVHVQPVTIVLARARGGRSITDGYQVSGGRSSPSRPPSP
ncbi:pyridoxamine 5'-phosphate oxidase family protein [Brevundimonas sp.]|uniref:pyridoxamine 5'-phosphate oxidase family protein n=1 Tax=Brevundimonas sp. TaxID=1871086 RepID=UPI002BAFC575|nr:pyridoxamine 5'-phosphate oxidase family protein [Brevundimonas sp.]HWQ86824.1 pyridoxamine 5'-phosphate oxidase family protein [Brevundimonas sp.]